MPSPQTPTSAAPEDAAMQEASKIAHSQIVKVLLKDGRVAPKLYTCIWCLDKSGQCPQGQALKSIDNNND